MPPKNKKPRQFSPKQKQSLKGIQDAFGFGNQQPQQPTQQEESHELVRDIGDFFSKGLDALKKSRGE